MTWGGSADDGRRRDWFAYGNFFPNTANCSADGAASLVFCDGLGENQFGAEAKSGRQAGAAIDDSDRNGIVTVFSAAANIKNELGGGQILAIDENQIVVVRTEFLGGGNPIQRTFATY
jgi:hypothetical protein